MNAWLNYIKGHWFLPYSLVILLGLGAFSVASQVISLTPSPYTKISFLDVGQGDGVLVTTPSHQRFLIDGGPGDRVVRLLSHELPWQQGVIDGLILTHPDADHLNGALAALQNFEVKNAFITGVFKETLAYRRFISELQQRNIPTFELVLGTKINVGSEISFSVLSPQSSVAGIFAPQANNTSAVVRLMVGERSFLLTGDIEAEIEGKLLPLTKHADVLKVAHHGSATSSSSSFIKSVSPGISVIMVGQNNTYGHPKQEILQRLAPSEIFRTDQNGTIDIWTDGKMIIAETQR